MKKTLIALSLFAFVGSTALATTVLSADSNLIELSEGGKDKKKKKKNAKECTEAEAKKATSCSKDAKKTCCKKKGAAEKK